MMVLKKVRIKRQSKKLPIQGARILRNEVPSRLTQKKLYILSADASRLAALPKLAICQILLYFRVLSAGVLNTKKL
jgi:hypothetical protein